MKGLILGTLRTFSELFYRTLFKLWMYANTRVSTTYGTVHYCALYAEVTLGTLRAFLEHFFSLKID